MRIKSRFAAGFLTLLAVGGLGFAAAPAGATTLTCTNTQSAVTAPYGCGGLEIAQPYSHGQLSLSTNGVQADSAPILVEPTNIASAAQDFTVFADSFYGTTGGPGSLGEYVAMVTPDAKIANFRITAAGSSGIGCVNTPNPAPAAPYTNAVPCAGAQFQVGANVYCLSVANFVGPNGKLRWWALERQCSSNGTFTYGSPSASGTVTHSFANRWQEWAPVNGVKGLKLVNVSLRNRNNSEYVLNITGGGGAGQQVQAYPDNSGGVANDQWDIDGCTPPITLLNTSYQFC